MNNKKSEEYPIKLSDWIIYLEGLSSTNTSLLVFIGTVFIITIIGVAELYRIYSFPSLGTLAMIFTLTIFFFKVNKKFQSITLPYQKLSEKIMLGKITQTKRVLEEYKRIKEERTKKRGMKIMFYRISSRVAGIIGIILVISGLIGIISQCNFWLCDKVIGLAILSIGIASISIALGIRSIIVAELSNKIANESKDLSEKSDNRVNNIANSLYLNLVNEIGNRDYELIFDKDLRRINTWKILIYIRQSKELLDFCKILPKNKERLFSATLNYLKKVSLFKSFMESEMLHHIISISEEVIEDLDDIKNKELNNIIRNLFDEKDDVEISLSYLKEKNTKLTSLFKENEKTKDKPYREIIKKLKQKS